MRHQQKLFLSKLMAKQYLRSDGLGVKECHHQKVIPLQGYTQHGIMRQTHPEFRLAQLEARVTHKRVHHQSERCIAPFLSGELQQSVLQRFRLALGASAPLKTGQMGETRKG